MPLEPNIENIRFLRSGVRSGVAGWTGLLAGGAGGVVVGGTGLPRLTSLLVGVGIGILNCTLGLNAVGKLDFGFLASVTTGIGSAVTGEESLVAWGSGVVGFSVDARIRARLLLADVVSIRGYK